MATFDPPTLSGPRLAQGFAEIAAQPERSFGIIVAVLNLDPEARSVRAVEATDMPLPRQSLQAMPSVQGEGKNEVLVEAGTVLLSDTENARLDPGVAAFLDDLLENVLAVVDPVAVQSIRCCCHHIREPRSRFSLVVEKHHGVHSSCHIRGRRLVGAFVRARAGDRFKD